MKKLNLPKTKEAVDKLMEAAIMVETWGRIWKERKRKIDIVKQNEGCFKDIGWSLDDKARVEFITEIEKDEDKFKERNDRNNEIRAKLAYKKKKEIEE